MKKKLDLNDIAKFEKAIAKKYGPEAIENPRKYWNDEKEKEYQEQLKKLAKKERLNEEKDDKVEQDGFLISKKLLNKDTTRRTCPVCKSYSFKIRDDVFKRYGTSINALSKIVTRISNLESQFRKVRNENDNYFRDVYKKVGENFTRYALSN